MFFTQKPGLLYIHLMKPANWVGKTLSLYHMKSIAQKARLLSSGEALALRVGKDLEGFGHWAIQLPEAIQAGDELGWVIGVSIQGDRFEVEALD